MAGVGAERESSLGTVFRSLDAELRQLLVQMAALDVEKPSCRGHVEAGQGKNALEILLFAR